MRTNEGQSYHQIVEEEDVFQEDMHLARMFMCVYYGTRLLAGRLGRRGGGAM
jgi:hypothetical protein